MSSKLCHEGQQLYRHFYCRSASLEVVPKPSRAVNPSARAYRTAATAIAGAGTGRSEIQSRAPLSEQAQQREHDREFFADLLSSAATKRDAKAYLSRLKSPTKPEAEAPKARLSQSGSYVNVGNLFRGSHAAEMSPVFSQSVVDKHEFPQQETLHVALVKIRDVAQLTTSLLSGIAETLTQLNRLSISPCVLVESSTTKDRASLNAEVDRLVDALNQFSDAARKVDNVFSMRSGTAAVAMRKLLTRPLRKGKIPVLASTAYNEDEQRMTQIPSMQAMLALTKEFAEVKKRNTGPDGPEAFSGSHSKEYRPVSLDRLITIDAAGGVPNDRAIDGRHVFLNLDQEYDIVRLNLQAKIDSPASLTHLENLDLLNQALHILPPSSSGLMTTYEEAANHSKPTSVTTATNVGTRRSKNALIHNLLTDKPAYSASLPLGRLTREGPAADASIISHSSFVKRGMPIKILPNPFEAPWTSDTPRLKLTDPRIDLDRLVYLIEDSFGRKLDVDDYLRRVNDRIAGVIIAGEYEGGAILTWETPPPSTTSSTSPLPVPVPYLDKFAVLKRSQGAGGVADIVFNAMVRSCFPNGVCWRSRKDNPVNKWYFERSTGTWKIPEMNWTMFWTTPNVERDSRLFDEYAAVCRGVMPSWADRAKPAD